jgi:hypothetical protein
MSSDACPACATATERPHWEFRADCRGCCARSIARSPQFFAARKVGGAAGPEVRAYRALLEQVGGLVKPALTHDDVRAAYAADALNRETA